MTPRSARRPVAVLCLTLAAGCGNNDTSGGTAECSTGDRLANRALAAMAQTVPTATLIPCVRSVPAGWSQAGLSVRNGRADFVLASDRDGDRALTVVLTATCDVAGASPVPSDQPGTRRFERPRRVDEGYLGDRYYVYPGGCTTYTFRLTGATRAQPITEISTAVGFVPRAAIAEMVRRQKEGRLELDPTPSRRPS